MSSLEHLTTTREQLLRRISEASPYLSLLESTLDMTLGDALISASEHVAPFNLPSTVSFALPYLSLQAAEVFPCAPLLIFAGSLVPLDNQHYPRGFYLPDRRRPARRLNMFSQRDAKTSAVLQPPRSPPAGASTETFRRRFPWLDSLDASSRFATFADQLAACMYQISSSWFPGLPGVRVIPLEPLATQILMLLLERADPMVDRLFLDAEVRAHLYEALRGVFCAWGDYHGSFLFWAADGRKLRSMWEREGRLFSEVGVEVPLQREALLEALRGGSIWPGVFVSLTMTSYLPGIPVLGGPKQLHYYRSMVRAVNAVTGLGRPETLSVYGYKGTNPAFMTPSPSDQRPFAPFGTGLDITERRAEPRWLVEQIKSAPWLAPPECPPLPYD